MATVLVVDDEPVICSLVAEVLKREGYSVLTAWSASQAVLLFRSHHEIDLLLSDITMPEMDGVTLARTLRAERPSLSVLLMSGCCESGQIVTSFDFLAKPFSITELAARVRELVQTWQAA
jgi:two-component system, cell cycle sensor histidine kinase and response regulator CckA